MNFEKYILGIPDFPKEGVLFYDITPLMANPEAYQQVIAELSAKIAQYKPTKIMAAESRGFFSGQLSRLICACLLFLYEKKANFRAKP